MRLPEKPIDWKKELNQKSNNFSYIIHNPSSLKQVVEFNKKYLYWSELKYKIKNESDLKYIWTFMKLLRSDKYEPIHFRLIKMKYNLISELNQKLNHFDRLLTENIGIHTKTLDLDKKYINSSLMEEAIASSIIEGASTTRKVAKAMLREKRKPSNKSERMIANNYNTMQFILEKKNEKMTPELLLNIQEMITKDTLEYSSDEGIFRDSNDIVVGDNIDPEKIRHTPPNHKKIPYLIDEFCEFANENSPEFIHPILKGIILHFLIGYIHPFNDGNGRTARSIFYWYMLSKGYWLFEYMAVSKRIVRSRKDYDLAYLYTEYDEMDLTYFMKYILECIDDSLKDMLDYIKRKQKEQEETKKIRYKDTDLNLRQATILENIIKNPNKIFTIKEISETYRIVYQTARTDLLLLSKKGYILKKISGKEFIFIYNEHNTFFEN